MDKKRFLKLNFKITFKISIAFFGILMLWQVYNTYCPIILEAMLKALGLTDTNYLVGIIMALDNVAAIFIMPIFGKLSDKTKTRFGKRMPYIIIGMLLTIVIFPFIAFMCMHNIFAGVITFMMLFLVIMQSYRSPAVALMPDLTPKPLRSGANGIVNLVGYMGGVFATVLGMFQAFKLNSQSTLTEIQNKVIWPFVICTIVLVIVLILLLILIRENRMLEETKEAVAFGEELTETHEEINEENKLSKQDRKNFIIILVAIVLWFMGFNSFETFGSLFFKNVVGDSTMYSLMATVLSVVSILTFLFFSTLSDRIGRKFSIIIGLFFIILGLVLVAIVSVIPSISFTNEDGNVILGWKIFYISMSIFIGFGWALVNVNSFPMVVEYSNPKNLGKFTSYYYISSMVAQSITPILAGLVMDFSVMGQKLLFVYASCLTISSLIVFIFVKEKVSIKDRMRQKRERGKSALERIGSIED